MDTASGERSYDPTEPTPPAREPPLRSTAPQSAYTVSQVGIGLFVFFVGLLVIVGPTVGLA